MPKFKKGDPKPANSGRRAGTPNKVTATIREIFEGAVNDMGGRQRLVEWAKAAPENERVFWQLATKLLPHQITGADEGPVKIEQIRRVIVNYHTASGLSEPVSNPKPVVVDKPADDKGWMN